MAKDININSAEWIDLVFEGRNKAYGAYDMRASSGNRHIKAYIIIVVLSIFISLLPTLIEEVKSMTQQKEAMVESTVLSDLKLEDMVKEENIIRQTEAPPPPPLKSTVKFTEIEITDQEIEEGQELKSQEELTSTKTQISVADVKGTDEEHGVDVADLEQNKVIVEEKPFTTVEQMPQFPGGDEELMKFILGNLNYPTVAKEVGVEGRVIIRFVVSRTGDVQNVEVLRGLDPSCDKEAVRVVKMMPKWIPEKQNGRTVPVFFTIPIVYKLAK